MTCPFEYINFYKVGFCLGFMGNVFGLNNPFYGEGRFAIYSDNCPDEHRMLVDGEHHVTLVRETLKAVGRGEDGAVDYVMKQLEVERLDVSREEVVQVLLRGRIKELEDVVERSDTKVL